MLLFAFVVNVEIFFVDVMQMYSIVLSRKIPTVTVSGMLSNNEKEEKRRAYSYFVSFLLLES